MIKVAVYEIYEYDLSGAEIALTTDNLKKLGLEQGDTLNLDINLQGTIILTKSEAPVNV